MRKISRLYLDPIAEHDHEDFHVETWKIIAGSELAATAAVFVTFSFERGAMYAQAEVTDSEEEARDMHRRMVKITGAGHKEDK